MMTPNMKMKNKLDNMKKAGYATQTNWGVNMSPANAFPGKR